FAEALGDVEIVLRHGFRRQQKNLLGRLGAVFQEVHQRLHAERALFAGELFDGGGHAAVADLGQRFGQRVEANDGDTGKPTPLHSLYGTQRHVVIGGDDDLGRFGEGRKSRFGDGQALVAGKPGGLLEDDLVFVLHRVEHIVKALVAVDRRRGAGLALQVDDRSTFREQFQDQFTLSLAALDIVRTHMGEDAFDRWYAAVDGDDRDAGLDGLLKCGSHGVDLIRADHDALDALGNRRLDVGRLFGRGDLAVGLDSLIALLLDLRL